MERAQRVASVSTLVTVLVLVAADAARGQQPFPSRPIRLIVPAIAGSQADTVSRMIGQRMAESWGSAVVIDNRAGGAGTIAAAIVAKSAPDGHTLMFTLPNFVISAVLQPNLPYDPLKDFAPVTHIGIATNVLVGSPALGARTVAELITLAKAQPGKLVFASGSAGSAGHLSALRFCLAAQIKVIHVSFKGVPEATIEVLAGRANLHLGTMGVTLPFIKEGKLVAFAVATPSRSPLLPDAPALAEMLPEFKRPDTSQGLIAPAGVPRPVLTKIGAEVARVLDLPDVKGRLQNIGYVTAPSSPEEYASLLRTQIETLSKVTVELGLKPK